MKVSVEAQEPSRAGADLLALAVTTLHALLPGARVNLERALLPTDRLGGHIVAGHVDGTAEVLGVVRSGDSWTFTFSLPAGMTMGGVSGMGIDSKDNLFILNRNDPVHHFDDCNIRSHIIVKAGELNSDRTRSDNQQLGRKLARGHRMAIGPDPLSIRRRKRQIAGPRAGCDDNVLGGQHFAALFAIHLQLARSDQPTIAHVNGDLVLLHQVSDALVELARHSAAALDHGS